MEQVLDCVSFVAFLQEVVWGLKPSLRARECWWLQCAQRGNMQQ